LLSRKSRGSGAVLAYRGHLLTENRNGLVVSTLTTRAYGSAERDAAWPARIGISGIDSWVELHAKELQMCRF